jgi:serine/threonine protein phosphatase PrpC
VFYARTDPGRQRDHNEDAIWASVLPDEGGDPSPWYLFAVADGLGGLERGDWASQTAIRVLTEQLPGQFVDHSPRESLVAAFRAANAATWEGNAKVAGKHRAATTLVAALVRHGTLWWAHVGDSRAYLVHQGRTQRLTRDHSWVDEQVRAGLMTSEQALISERRHAITRSIGYDVSVEVDAGGPMPLRPGDILVLCSDGLHDQVTDEELASVVLQLLPEAAADRLVALSNERGGPDNISVILCTMFDASVDAARTGLNPANQATLP